MVDLVHDSSELLSNTGHLDELIPLSVPFFALVLANPLQVFGRQSRWQHANQLKNVRVLIVPLLDFVELDSEQF